MNVVVAAIALLAALMLPAKALGAPQGGSLVVGGARAVGGSTVAGRPGVAGATSTGGVAMLVTTVVVIQYRTRGVVGLRSFSWFESLALTAAFLGACLARPLASRFGIA